MGSSPDGQEVVIEFNRDHMIGTHVQYWTGVREGRGKFSTTRSAAELLGGHTPVVWVAGHEACIALTHVEPVPHQPDGIEEVDDKTIPAPTLAAERVLAYVTEFGDGLYDVAGGAPLYGRDLVALAKALDRPCGECHPCENYGPLQVAQKIADDNDRLRELLAAAQRQVDVARELVGTVRAIAETWRTDPGAFPDGAADPLEQIATVLLGPPSTRKR